MKTLTRAVRRRPGRPAAAALAALLCLGAAGTPAATAAPAGPAAPAGRIVNADAPHAVTGSYLVTLSGAAPRAASARGTALAERHGARVLGTYDSVLNGYHVRATERQARRLAADPAVAAVEQDTAVRLPEGVQTDPPSCGLDRIDQEDLPLDGRFTYPASAGAGVTAYVVDTGIHYSHEDFGGRAVPGFDVTGGDGSDGNGHGTHVAGVVAGAEYGVAKQAGLVSVKVLDDAGSGTLAGVIAGLDWLTEDAGGPAVANLSIGGAASQALDDAVRASIASGVSYAVAAGGGNAGDYSPGRVAEAITVGASTCDDQVAPYSGYGPALQLYAPGSSIVSAWHTSDDATATLSGTSVAAPHASGVAALYLADHPAASPAGVWGAMDAAAALDKLTGVPPDTDNKLLQVVD